ncbi:MAG: 5-formyltetrahydrofolate cyclo-ligase, partial [Oscillospiraceae bacterium]
MQKIDLREYKSDLRSHMKAIRKGMEPQLKAKLDRKIFKRLTSLREYHEADTLLTYVSSAIEVDTIRLINHSIALGKNVAVPRCDPSKHGLMEFYYINSFSELEKGTFGILEPNPEFCTKVGNSGGNKLCIVPALSYDMLGYRLGYGGGYYDRFLACFDGKKVGIIYKDCLSKRLIHGRYDVPVDVLVTENFIRNIGVTLHHKADNTIKHKNSV